MAKPTNLLEWAEKQIKVSAALAQAEQLIPKDDLNDLLELTESDFLKFGLTKEVAAKWLLTHTEQKATSDNISVSAKL